MSFKMQIKTKPCFMYRGYDTFHYTMPHIHTYVHVPYRMMKVFRLHTKQSSKRNCTNTVDEQKDISACSVRARLCVESLRSTRKICLFYAYFNFFLRRLFCVLFVVICSFTSFAHCLLSYFICSPSHLFRLAFM